MEVACRRAALGIQWIATDESAFATRIFLGAVLKERSLRSDMFVGFVDEFLLVARAFRLSPAVFSW